MSTLRLRAAQSQSLPDFFRLGFFLAALVDIFAEAQASARAANERYPFIE